MAELIKKLVEFDRLAADQKLSIMVLMMCEVLANRCIPLITRFSVHEDCPAVKESLLELVVQMSDGVFSRNNPLTVAKLFSTGSSSDDTGGAGNVFDQLFMSICELASDASLRAKSRVDAIRCLPAVSKLAESYIVLQTLTKEILTIENNNNFLDNDGGDNDGIDEMEVSEETFFIPFSKAKGKNLSKQGPAAKGSQNTKTYKTISRESIKNTIVKYSSSLFGFFITALEDDSSLIRIESISAMSKMAALNNYFLQPSISHLTDCLVDEYESVSGHALDELYKLAGKSVLLEKKCIPSMVILMECASRNIRHAVYRIIE